MRGSAVFRTGVAPGGALAGPWVKNELWTRARAVPSLDLRFADNKSLVDATTGSNLVTFTRASSGTFVGSDGVLQTATTNLLLQSEDFSVTWAIANASIGSNSTTSPNGATTADILIENTLNAQHNVSQTLAIPDNTVITVSVYAKAFTRNWIRFSLITKAGVFPGAFFDVSTGSTGSLISSPIATSIIAVGNGWYRCSVTADIGSGATTPGLRLWVANANNSISYTGDGTSGIFVWGAQLEQSATVGEYIPTTSTINSAPRFDHNPTTGESLGLLVEEQRTNLLLRSEEFDNASWTLNQLQAFGSGSVANAIASPSGSITADLITENTANSEHNALQAVTVTANTVYTLSCFAKKGTRSILAMSPTAPGVANYYTFFNLDTGAIVFNEVGNTPAITALGNGWYRCSITRTTGAAQVTSNNKIGIANNTLSTTYTGDGTSGIYLWGAQLEAGAFPTSYIKTEAAAATRSADVASITGSAFSGWYSQDEGTVFVDATGLGTGVPSGDFQTLAGFSDGTNNNRIELGYLTGSTGNLNIRQSGSASADMFPSINTPRRLGTGSYSISGAAVSFNGLTPTEDTSVVLPTANKLDIGGLNSTGIKEFHGTIRRLTYWPQRLVNSTLQTLTQ